MRRLKRDQREGVLNKERGKIDKEERLTARPEGRETGWVEAPHRVKQSKVKQRNDANKARGLNLLHYYIIPFLYWFHTQTTGIPTEITSSKKQTGQSIQPTNQITDM